jgi:hypothetical protein
MLNNLVATQPTAAKPVVAQPIATPTPALKKVRAPTIYATANAKKPSAVLESNIDSETPLTTIQAKQVKQGKSLIDTDNRNSGGALSVLSNMSTAAPSISAPAPTVTTVTSPGATNSTGQPMVTAGASSSNAALATPAATPIINKYNTQTNAGALPFLNQNARTTSATGEKSSDYQTLINPQTDTVEGRTANLLKSGNPLLEQAKTNALQSANARGLLNSSIGVEAGEQAVLNQAESIASRDAAAYNTQRQGLQEIEQSAWNNYFSQIANVQLQQIPEEDKKTAMDNINAIMKGSPHVGFVNSWRSMP